MHGQGQSLNATVDKERCLQSAMTVSLRIGSARKLRDKGYSYWHFDANAGSGHNRICEVPGSPIAFHVAADKSLCGLTRQAFFCDKDEAAIAELSGRIARWKSTSFLLPGDNQDGLDVFAERIQQAENPRFAVGSVIVDPNGYWYRKENGDGVPTNLVAFAQKFPRIDIILNLNIRTFWLQRSHYDILSPHKVLSQFGKAHWLIRQTKKDHGRWLLAVGRNFETPAHRPLEFAKLESDTGREIMRWAENGH